MVRRTPSLVLLVVLASCSLLTNTDGLTRDGPTDVSPTEGGVVDAAPVVDAAADGASSTSDAEPSPLDGTTPATCNTSATLFCDDFESGALLPKWSDTGTFTSGAGSVVLDSAVAFTGTHSLRSRLPAAGGSCQTAFAEKAFRGTFSKISGSVMVRQAISAGSVITMGLGGEDDRCEAFVNADGNQLALYVQNYIGGSPSQSDYTTFTVPFPRDAWTKVSFDADFAGNTISITVGQETRQGALPSCPFDPSNAFVALGLSCEKSASDERIVYFDDVVAEAKP